MKKVIVVIILVVFSLCIILYKDMSSSNISIIHGSTNIYDGIPNYQDVYQEEILNGAYPELEDNMIPIYYDGTWKKADVYEKWYSYEEFNWANVAIVKDDKLEYYQSLEAGSNVLWNDVVAYFVWIPRFEYQLFNVELNPVEEQMINVRFVSKDEEKKTNKVNGLYYTHPAFSSSDKEINGFWVAKFEPSLNNGKVEILPSKNTLVNINMAQMVAYATSVSEDYDLDITSRILTNMEYGAIAYLTYSNYGKRNNSDYEGKNRLLFLNTGMGDSSWSRVVTGCSSGTYIHGGTYYCPYSYDYPYYGTGASSTGTIYGVYDLAGGSWECVMGIVSDYPIKDNIGGYEGSLIDNKDYYTLYSASNNMYNYSRSILGDAMGEVIDIKNSSKTWNNNLAYFATTSYPWIKRGGSFRGGSYSGIFDFGITDALARGDKTFRVILSSK